MVFLITVIPSVYTGILLNDKDFFVKESTAAYRRFSERLAYADIDESISADISFFGKESVFSRVKLSDAKIGESTVSAEIVTKGRFTEQEEKRSKVFRGRLFTDNITWEDKVLMPLKILFAVDGDKVVIESLYLGDYYNLGGEITTASPFKTDLHFMILRADIRDFIKLADMKNTKGVLGIVSGSVRIRGDLNNLFSTGSFESRHGRIGSIDYDSAVIKFEGFGPMINLVDSRIRYGDSIITIEGYMDLRNMNEGGFFDSLSIKSDMKEIAWDGWDIKRRGKDELSMTKDINEKMKVGLKTATREPLIGYREEEKPEEVSLEYKLGAENLKMKIKDDEEFFGIEHNMRF